jgi:hypothetical protein
MAKRDRGRPKGSYSKPQIRDYIGNPDIKALTEKAVEMAKAGDPTMLKFVLEQIYGKAPQSVDLNGGLELNITFDDAFKSAFKTKGDS